MRPPRLLSIARRYAGRVGLAGWLVATSLGASTLLAGHLLELPVADDPDAVVAATIAERRTPGEDGLLVLHVLYEKCGCSKKVLRDLLGRPATAGVTERILFVGHDEELAGRARRLGYEIEELDATQLEARYALISAPLLAILGADDGLAYLGGYTHRKRGPEPRHREIIASLQRGDSVERLPVFGCAVTRDLRAAVDPLGLR